MIIECTGDLLKANARALVNPVNCVGVMGKGLAKQFKEQHPESFVTYAAACREGRVQRGRVLIHDYAPDGDDGDGVRWIIQFPTKGHWRQPSRLCDIKSGLDDLVTQVNRRGIKSIAIPPLGCGLGGLNPEHVKPLIKAAFEPLTEVNVLLYWV